MTQAPAALRRMDELAARFEDALRAYVRAATREGVPVLHEAMAYALGTDIDDAGARGKRIRPVLCLLTAEALGADLELAEPFALAIELMHNFCLVHDDLEDGDVMRRGRESVWVKYGTAHGVNVGDYLLVHTQSALANWGTPRLDAAMRFRLMKLLSHALDRTHIGQAMDISARGEREFTMEQYLRLVREKTGYYLAAPIQGGAIVAGADEVLIESLGRLALLLGPMFQIADDLIDLTHGKGREARGSDIREGKRSFMVAHAAANCDARDRARMFEILDKPREATTGDEVAWCVELFERCGAIKAGNAHCRELYEQSAAMLAEFPRPLAEALAPVLESLSRRER